MRLFLTAAFLAIFGVVLDRFGWSIGPWVSGSGFVLLIIGLLRTMRRDSNRSSPGTADSFWFPSSDTAGGGYSSYEDRGACDTGSSDGGGCGNSGGD